MAPTLTTLSLLLSSISTTTLAKTVRQQTPPMGWNSYNAYNCQINSTDITHNAQGLIDYNLTSLGYTLVTPDCGWMTNARDANTSRLQWDLNLFPEGGKGLGDWLHARGLKFGLYSGAGYWQCGSTDLPASLGYEEIDAQSFSEWGGDSLKYDNCYSTSKTVMVDSSSAEAQAPTRFQKMADELEKVERGFQMFVCQWGIGENVGDWASQIGNTWRMSNDIYNAWRSIWRISNQVVPYYRNTKPGAFPDMDMLIVGLNAISEEEERFHFGMWAINKSPLILGSILDEAHLSPSALATISNKEIVAINQDALAKQARLIRRYTQEEWDIWLGELSDSRKVLGLANWKDAAQSVSVDLTTLGIQSASVRDAWAAKDLGSLSGSQTFSLKGHEMKILVLSDITAATPLSSTQYYSAATNSTLSGAAHVVTCSTSTCLPTGKKIGDLSATSSVTFPSVESSSSGTKILGVDFVNYDYAFTTSWGWGDNIRNMTIAVNGGEAKRWAFPLSGQNWEESGRLEVEVGGFVEGGGNKVVFSGIGDGVYAPDFVGFEVLE